MLHRTDKYTDSRFYFDDESRKFYISATTFCKKVLPENTFLVKWKQELGVFEANRRATEAAHYGTIMHIICEDFLGGINYGEQQMRETIEEYCAEHEIEGMEKSWPRLIKRDLLSFAQWAYEKAVEVIHCERWVKHDVNEHSGIAGTLDLECTVKFGQGRKAAIVDFKSGKKGFFISHELQLHLYKMILGDPDMMVFNWAPNNWKTEPTYKFKNQTKSPMAAKLPLYLKLAELDGIFKPTFKQLDFEPLRLGEKPVFTVKGLEKVMMEEVALEN